MTRRFWRRRSRSPSPVLALAMGEMLPGDAAPAPARLPRASRCSSSRSRRRSCSGAAGRSSSARWRSVRTRKLNMFTLIALGTGAAYAYSLVATLAARASSRAAFREHGGAPRLLRGGGGHRRRWCCSGRCWSSARAAAPSRRDPRAARPRAEDGAPRSTTDGAERGRRRSTRSRPATGCACGPARRCRSTASSSRARARSTSRWSPASRSRSRSGPATASPAARSTRRARFVMRAERVGQGHAARADRPRWSARRSGAARRSSGSPTAWRAGSSPPSSSPRPSRSRSGRVVGPEPRLAHALVTAVAVLIIACPCALGLATPMSIMVGDGPRRRAGVLVQERRGARALREGRHARRRQDRDAHRGRARGSSVALVAAPGASSQRDELAPAAGREPRAGSEHPLAAAIVAGARSARRSRSRRRGLPVARPARASSGASTGTRSRSGTRALLAELGVDAGAARARAPRRCASDGQTVMLVAVDGRAGGPPRRSPTRSSQARRGAPRAARRGAPRRDADRRQPDHRAAVAREARDRRRRGGGAARPEGRGGGPLARSGRRRRRHGGRRHQRRPRARAADVGIAMGTGTDVAIESAGVTLVSGDLRGIVRARRLSRATMRNIRQNLFFAFVYNASGVPIAAGVLYPFFGVLLSPDDRERGDELQLGLGDRERAPAARRAARLRDGHPRDRAGAPSRDHSKTRSHPAKLRIGPRWAAPLGSRCAAPPPRAERLDDGTWRLGVGRLPRARAGDARARPRGVQPQGPRDPAAGGARLVRALDHPRPRVRRVRVDALRQRARARVPHRLRHREVALGRQHLRVRRDLRRRSASPRSTSTACCSGGSSARSSCAARSSSAGAALLDALPLDDLRLRRVPRAHRGEAPRRAGSAPHPEKSPAFRALRRFVPATPRYSTATASSPSRTGGGVATPLFFALVLDRGTGRGVRGGLDPGDLRGDRRPVHRLHVQHLRDPGPALALLPARGLRRPVHLPEAVARRWCSCSSARRWRSSTS